MACLILIAYEECPFVLDQNKSCGICESGMIVGSTTTDVICPSCAKQQDLYKQCGTDIELKDRRKPYPFEDTTINS